MRHSEQTEAQSPGSTREARVAVVRCPSYEAEVLSGAVRQSLELVGGLDSFLDPGTKVFVKINHLSPHAPPDRAICTHPAFVREVLRGLLERDVRLTVGDDVNFGRGDEFVTSGFRQVCAELGVPLVNLRETGFAKIPLRGWVLKSVYVARPVLEADLVLNLPKLKTHSFTAFTGAIKNMYGVIPYGLRLDGHRRFLRGDLFLNSPTTKAEQASTAFLSWEGDSRPTMFFKRWTISPWRDLKYMLKSMRASGF